ncbi:MAG: iron-containing alcohol dehydrogenase [Planctomycetota bacterium]
MSTIHERSFELLIPTRVVFRKGGLDEAGHECRKLRLSRPYVFTDHAVLKLGFIERLEKALLDEDITIAGVFSELPPGDTLRTVAKATEEMARSAADGIVAVGGGTVMNFAKAVNILLVKGGQLVDYQATGVLDDAPIVTHLCIPTTAGTGCEVSTTASVLDAQSKKKLRFTTRRLAADAAILDPALTVSLPPDATASGGFAALTHAMEAVLSKDSQPATEGLALSAIGSIIRWLPTAVQKGDDLEARGRLLLAANMAGIACSNAGGGVVLACSGALEALREIPQAVAAAVLLPHGLRFNLDVASTAEKKKLLAGHLGGDDVPAKIAEFASECGLPSKLKDLGVKEEDFRDLAAWAADDRSLRSNPRDAERPELMQLFQSAF